MRLKYSFEINEEGEFSSEDVARQNKDNDVIIINALDSNNCLLMLNKDFLDKFSLKDEIMLCGEPLCPLWGYSSEYIISCNSFVMSSVDIILESPFRCRIIDTDDLELIDKEIKNTKLFLESKQKKRNIIFVHTFDK